MSVPTRWFGPPAAGGAAAADRPARLRGAAPWLGLGGWAILVVTARFVGLAAVHRDPRAALFFPPLAVRWDPRFPPLAALPLLLGALLIWGAPLAVKGLPWRRLLVVGYVATAGWAVALASVDGVPGLTGDANYLADISRIGGPAAFLAGFVRSIATYSQHVRAHPPGFVLLLWVLRRIGLGGPGWEAVLVVVVGSATVPAALVAMREVAGEARARAAAPFLALSPIMLWLAVSGDAFIMGVSTTALALLILATGRSGHRSDGLGAAGGLLFGATLFLSYGLTLLALVPVSVAIVRRRARPLLVASLAVLAVALAFAWAGFGWLDGLRASIEQYRISASRFRPQSAFWLIDLGAFALALGPAAGAGLAALRDPRTWLLAGAALLAVALADASGLSRGEVERIWLPFSPWILMACSSLAPLEPTLESLEGQRSRRWWLAAQIIACLALQFTLRGP